MTTKKSRLARALVGEPASDEPLCRSPAARRARGFERLPGGFVPQETVDEIALLGARLGIGGPLAVIALAVREACIRRGIEVGEKKDRPRP